MANAYYPEYGQNARQGDPVLSSYSPRLFGAPPQLTNLCDMRYLSSPGSGKVGPVGDFYLQNILKDAQIANFVVGKALFTGGQARAFDAIRTFAQYTHAMTEYGVSANVDADAVNAANRTDMDTYAKSLGLEGVQSAEQIISDAVGSDELSKMQDALSGMGSGLSAALLSSFTAMQPWYTFEADWHSYIQRTKTMIKTAAFMLGLQNAPVKIGPTSYGYAGDDETWEKYRYITVNDGDKGAGSANEATSQNGDSTQYVSFMVEPNGGNESYSNTFGASQFFNISNTGGSIGNEVAFLTNSTATSVDDKALELVGDATGIIGSIMSNLGGTVGRFSAALVGGLSRSFLGDHIVMPDIHQASASSQAFSFSINLNASGGDPYSYFIDILVPICYLLGMTIPNMANNNAAGYSYPPLIQVSVPGLYGVRLGAIQSLNFSKKNMSVRGYPLSVTVTMQVQDLYHTLFSSPIDSPASFLNNSTMFDYMAHCCGVDKYRVNGSMRILSKINLLQNYKSNFTNYLGDAVLSDFNGFVDKITGIPRMT